MNIEEAVAPRVVRSFYAERTEVSRFINRSVAFCSHILRVEVATPRRSFAVDVIFLRSRKNTLIIKRSRFSSSLISFHRDASLSFDKQKTKTDKKYRSRREARDIIFLRIVFACAKVCVKKWKLFR